MVVAQTTSALSKSEAMTLFSRVLMSLKLFLISRCASPFSLPFNEFKSFLRSSFCCLIYSISSWSGCCSISASKVLFLSDSLTLTGLPILTALTPILTKPSNKLSTATFDSAQASMGPLPICESCFNK